MGNSDVSTGIVPPVKSVGSIYNKLALFVTGGGKVLIASTLSSETEIFPWPITNPRYVTCERRKVDFSQEIFKPAPSNKRKTCSGFCLCSWYVLPITFCRTSRGRDPRRWPERAFGCHFFQDLILESPSASTSSFVVSLFRGGIVFLLAVPVSPHLFIRLGGEKKISKKIFQKFLLKFSGTPNRENTL